MIILYDKKCSVIFYKKEKRKEREVVCYVTIVVIRFLTIQ